MRQLKGTAAGLDEFPSWLWKVFALELSPILIKIFDLSIKLKSVSKLWKLANVNPIPKEFPVTDKQQQSIAIANIIMKMFYDYVPAGV